MNRKEGEQEEEEESELAFAVRADEECFLEQKYPEMTPVRKEAPTPRFKKQSLDSALASMDWGVDTMASVHLTGNRRLLSNVRRVSGKEITMADGTKMFTTDVGSVSLRVWSEEKNNAVTTTIQDVYYHEKVTANLLSWGKLAKLGWILHSSDKGSYVVTPGKNRVPLSTRGQVLVMEHEGLERVYVVSSRVCTTIEDLVRLHERLPHGVRPHDYSHEGGDDSRPRQTGGERNSYR